MGDKVIAGQVVYQGPRWCYVLEKNLHEVPSKEVMEDASVICSIIYLTIAPVLYCV